jgi:phosphohistidine phosphatase
MEIYILRHGAAEDARPGHPDAERQLTEEGREKLRNVLRRAQAAKVEPSLILTSPLVRAVQTAELAARILGYKGKLATTDALLPSSSPPNVWEEIRSRRDESVILLAGHEPLLSQVVAFLLGAPGLQVDLKKAALARIQMDRFGPAPKGILQWLITPRVAAG